MGECEVAECHERPSHSALPRTAHVSVRPAQSVATASTSALQSVAEEVYEGREGVRKAAPPPQNLRPAGRVTKTLEAQLSSELTLKRCNSDASLSLPFSGSAAKRRGEISKDVQSS